MPSLQHDKVIRGRVDTWACKLARFLFLGMWLFVGYSLFDAFGFAGIAVFIVASTLMGFLPTVQLVEPLDDDA